MDGPGSFDPSAVILFDKMAYPSPNPALDGESRKTEIIVILSVACTLSTLAVVLRCYSRGVILRSFGMDDAMIVPAQVNNPSWRKPGPVLTRDATDPHHCLSCGNWSWYETYMVTSFRKTLMTDWWTEAKYGLGRHAWTMPEEQYIPYMKVNFSKTDYIPRQ